MSIHQVVEVFGWFVLAKWTLQKICTSNRFFLRLHISSARLKPGYTLPQPQGCGLKWANTLLLPQKVTRIIWPHDFGHAIEIVGL